MILVDTNVVIDILTNNARWADWSGARLSEAAGVTAINIVVVAELSKGFASLDALRHKIGRAHV